MRSMGNHRRGLTVLRGPVLGVLSFAALSYLAAELVVRGVLPAEAAGPAMLLSLLLASVFAGACSGGAGKRGMFTGGILAILYLLGKAAFHPDAFFDLKTLFGLLCTLPGAWLGSCIFHKNKGCYTKRNHKNRRKIYK